MLSGKIQFSNVLNRGRDGNGEGMIPEEHQLICVTCGQIIDARDLSEVIAHENCNRVKSRHNKSIQFTSSKKVGDNIEWTNDKKPIHLN